MTVEEIRDRVLALEQRAERMDERQTFLQDRVVILEKTQSGVQDIRLMIERLMMGSDNTKQNFLDLNVRLDWMAKRIEEIDNKLEAHTAEPGKKWESAKWLIVAGVITGVIGYIIGKIP